MSVIFYCDGPSCGNKVKGVGDSDSWRTPSNWSRNIIEDVIFDACSEACMDKITAAHEPAEEEDAKSAST